MPAGNSYLKVYHGYGHTHNLVLYGHVFRKPLPAAIRGSRFIPNMLNLFRLFTLRPKAGVRVRLYWEQQVLETRSEKDGFFKFEWTASGSLGYGWHPLKLKLPDEPETEPVNGKVYVPHSTQYAFISDIDDTVMVSHSATLFRRLKELLFRNPATRKVFADVAKHYSLLAEAHTSEETANPFFYVSSSEWNLYDYLDRVFRKNGFPEGVFLLNQAKHWSQLLLSGKTGHSGKLLRIIRIMEAFPRQQFVLMGDNSQSDPGIYAAIVQKYPAKIAAIYIRNVRKERRLAAEQLLRAAEQSGVKICVYNNSSEAIAHSQRIGLI